MPSRRWSTLRKIIVASATVAAIAAMIAVLSLWTNDGLSPDEVQQLVHDKNVALGYLENQELDKAIAAFSKLARQAPDDPLPWHNLAVARVVALGDEEMDVPPAALEEAKAALEEMSRREGATADYQWLALRTALARRDASAAETHLAALIALEPEDAAVWYAKFRASQLLDGTGLEPEVLKALERACELRPENAWLRLEWLRTVG